MTEDRISYYQGNVDDVVINNVDFRLERMSEKAVWVAAYRGQERIAFWLNIIDGEIHISIDEKGYDVPEKHEGFPVQDPSDTTPF